MAGGWLTLASGWFGTRMRCAKSSFSQELRARPREQSVHHDGNEIHELRSIRRGQTHRAGAKFRGWIPSADVAFCRNVI